MKISRHQIAALAAVGREKRFSRAAKMLGVSQSAVTQHIRQLEESVGCKLLIRSRDGSELTATGRKLYALADKIRVLEDLFLEKANKYSVLDEVSLSVCVSTPKPALAVVSAYKRRYPGVKVDLMIAPWREAIAKVRGREVDLAIVIQPENHEGLFSLGIERRPFVAVLPQAHRLSRSSSIGLAELVQETLVMLTQGSYTRFWVDKKLAEYQLSPVSTLTITSYEMMFEAVQHSLGVSIALEGSVTHSDQVVTIPLTEFQEEHTYSVVCLEENVGLRIIRGFLDVASSGIHSGQAWSG
jgi:DNA-binding transcriptional LysR family regulator